MIKYDKRGFYWLRLGYDQKYFIKVKTIVNRSFYLLKHAVKNGKFKRCFIIWKIFRKGITKENIKVKWDK